MRTRTVAALGAALLLATGCRGGDDSAAAENPGPPADMPRPVLPSDTTPPTAIVAPAVPGTVLPDVPVFSPNLLSDTTTAVEVERRAWIAGAQPDSVRTWYRNRLRQGGWTIAGDQQQGTMIRLHATKGRRLAWIEISPQYGQSRLVIMARLGPGTDSAAAAPRR